MMSDSSIGQRRNGGRICWAFFLAVFMLVFGNLKWLRIETITRSEDDVNNPELFRRSSQNVARSTDSEQETPHESESFPIEFDPVEKFHIPAYNRIKELVTDNSMISWGFKKEKGMPDEFRLKAVLSSLPIRRLHGRSNDVKQAIWKNQTHMNSTGVTVLWESKICDAIEIARRLGSDLPAHVLFTRCGENFGDFSRSVPDHKTAGWNMAWEAHGCNSEEEVHWYLNQSQTKAVITSQHHFLDHPKVHSLPLGIKHTMKYQVLRALREPRANKTKLLMLNDNGWKHRKEVTKVVMENFGQFNHTLKNTYSNKKSKSYLEELKRSKFILAPSGLGWDCYRIWEALHFNTIPVIERYYRPHDGWRRTLDGLPVLFVEDFRNLTPSVLEQAYIRITSKGADYEYEKLTSHWWESFVLSQFHKK